MKKITVALCSVLVVFCAAAANVQVTVNGTGKPISPDLFGIFFEDINFAADGGLYAELVQNRSFEYSALERPDWNPLTCWDFVTRGGGRGSMKVANAVPVHANNPQYAVLEVQQAGEGVGLMNSGFDGIPVKAGEQYNFSVFARQLYTGGRWDASKSLASAARLAVRLESKEGVLLGETAVEISGREWQRLSATLTPTNSDTTARLVLLTRTRGAIALDEVSLFPQDTFRNRPNGMRRDLAETIAALKPKFMRFPGGCLVHGYSLGNLYRWKDTIGPVEQRRQQPNIWGYHQSVGLGYYEYFQFCEDIGAKPLPVLPAAVCCQNADDQGGTGQRGLPMELMPAYVQEVLDLIEWANGPTNSFWGAKRAAAGHPKPFGLQYVGIGNEENITPVFKERFAMIYQAMKAKHPEITVIGTVGPSPRGEDFDAGWKFANELHVPMVDEHYYESPEWFLRNLNRYDSCDRAKSKVYLGEYAAQERNRVNTLRTALAEAAYMTSLERNGDVVHLASYAPLLAREGHTQWRPDMIYFTGTSILLTPNYYAQQMFSCNQGDVYLPTAVAGDEKNLAASCVQDTKSGDVILKLVNNSTNTIQAQVNLPKLDSVQSKATRTLLAGDAMASNSWKNPNVVAPATDDIAAGQSFPCEVPANSVTVIRLKTR